MKKIPRDAEASNVLVGEVDFLNKPFVAFVRLAQATTLGGLTEVPVPTRWEQKSASSNKKPLAIEITWPHTLSHLPRRFLFILLGPQGKAKSYNEIGRAIATLMVDDVSVRDVPSSHADNDTVNTYLLSTRTWHWSTEFPLLLCFN